MPAGQPFHGPGEIFSRVVRPVIGGHPVDAGDPVGGEERPGPAEDPDRGSRFLIVEGPGVGQPGESVRGRVEVGVPDALLVGAFGSQGLSGASPVGPPTTTVRDSPELLHIQVDHVPGPSGPDPPRWVPQVLPGRGEIT